MPSTHSPRMRVFALTLACFFGLAVSRDARAQAPAPAPAAPAPAAAPAPQAASPAPAPAAAPAPQAASPAPAPAPTPVAPAPPQPAPYPPAYTPLPPEQGGWSAAPALEESAERPSISFGYEISTPVGDLHDFVSETSFRGFEVGALWPIYRSLYLGAVFNYHLFYEELGKKTYQVENGALTGNLYRYAQYWTVQAEARYLFLAPDAVARPFAGLRVGMAFATTATLVSDLSLYDTPTGFALAPEAGVLVSLASVMQLSGSIRYDFSTVSSGDMNNGSYMAYQLGLVFHQN
jgi:hypothetical protein